eukprot:10921956-Heterocapsa_arctica.AAC.2
MGGPPARGFTTKPSAAARRNAAPGPASPVRAVATARWELLTPGISAVGDAAACSSTAGPWPPLPRLPQ